MKQKDTPITNVFNKILEILAKKSWSVILLLSKLLLGK